MNLGKAIERCNELIKEKHANWIGLTSQEAISTVLQEKERLQKENEELKEKNNKIREKIEEIEKMANGNKIIENTIRYKIEMALLKKLLKEE